MLTATEINDRRARPAAALAAAATSLTAACQDLADRFGKGGTLLVFGEGAGMGDARHIAVEFMHPAVVGKRALPALALDAEPGDDLCYLRQISALADPGDIALGIAPRGTLDQAVLAGLAAA